MKNRAKITALCNQKGGVGKTVTAVNLGIGLAREGKRVLLADIAISKAGLIFRFTFDMVRISCSMPRRER